ncbi:MAG TPA: alpha/beta hydrolase, partial [Steroidobacteraceae bacterium]|nr:alpha/beta hydrolase [Steroidobacteraceae bacterium]
MPFVTAKDGTNIFYKDWGSGKPIVFSHGWPLNADAWDAQMLFLGSKGYRVIAHDRRGHGRSGQTWDGNEMDTYAEDVAALFTKLDLKDAVFIGHSTGGGEVAHY